MEALGYLAFGDTGWSDEIARGVLITASLALATLPIGLAIGFLLALAKQSREESLRLAADVYTTIFRGLPELLTIFMVYYGMQIGIRQLSLALGFEGGIEINAFAAGMIALAVVFSSFASEVFLSAFRAIPAGQYEAGDALGLGNLWLILLKDTAYISVIGLSDIMRQAGIAARVTKEAFLFFGIACLLYLALAMLSSVVFSRIEQAAKRSEARS